MITLWDNIDVVSNISKNLLDTFHFKNGVQALEYKFYLCDNYDNVIDVLEVKDDFAITHNMNSTIKRTLELTILDMTIDLLNKRIKPCVIAENTEFPLGIFCIESPTKELKNNVVTRKIKGYDKTVILRDDCLLENLFFPNGTIVTNAIKEIIYGSGIRKVDITTSDKILNRDYEFLIGTSRLEIVNTLLEYINYTSIYFGNSGFAEAEDYILPTDREIDFNYITNSISIIKTDRTLELDLFNVPNVFIAISSNGESESLTSIYINDNPNSKVSTVSRGRNITKIYEVSDIANQETLDSYVRRLAYNYTATYEKIVFSTSIIPLHENGNCLYIDDDFGGIRGNYIETSWTIRNGEMEHNARKVVSI